MLRQDAKIRELARVAANAHPDLVVVKENEDHLRGRKRGKVPRIIRAAVLATLQSNSGGLRMTLRTAATPARTISSEEAAGFVASGMWLDYGVALCQPDNFDQALAARKDLRDVKIRSCLTMTPRATIESDPEGERFHSFSWHFSGYDRRKHDAGRCHYIPLNLGEVPDYYRRFVEPVDIVILRTCPIDEHGYFNFSVGNLWHRAMIERARMVIVEVSRGLPYAHGEQNGVHVS